MTPEHMLLVTAQPITTSDGKGSRRGTLIFARYINDHYVNSLSLLSGMNVAFSPYGFVRSETNMSNTPLSRGVPVIAIEDGMVSGRLLVENIFGNPSLALGITYPATLLESGRGSIGQTLGTLFPGFLVYVSILLLCLEIFLVRRIENIRQVVRQVNTLHPGGVQEGDLDDFSYLSGVMIGAIEKVQESNDLADVTWNEIAKFRLALDQSFDHMIITDVDGKILYANLAAEKMTGYSRVEMQGKTPALSGKASLPVAAAMEPVAASEARREARGRSMPKTGPVAVAMPLPSSLKTWKRSCTGAAVLSCTRSSRISTSGLRKRRVRATRTVSGRTRA